MKAYDNEKEDNPIDQYRRYANAKLSHNTLRKERAGKRKNRAKAKQEIVESIVDCSLEEPK